MSTGIFFYYQQGERLKDFPDELGKTLSRPNVFFYDAFYPRKPESAFDPEAIFWNWGYDGTIGEYGDMGLTAQLHVQLASQIKSFAAEGCNGRLVVILCGGSRRDLATLIIPRIVEVLASK